MEIALSENNARPSMVSLSMADAWRRVLQKRTHLAEGILTIVLFCIVVKLASLLALYVERRHGAILADPLQRMFYPRNVTWIAFALLWTSVFGAIAGIIHVPKRFFMGFQAAGLVLLFRMLAMYLNPVDPPRAIIPMADPIIESLGTGQLVTRDLFFSGHTSTMVVLYFATVRKWLKWYLLFATAAVGVCMVTQHVHYSIDVYAAPFFAYASWRIVVVLHERFEARESA